MTAAPIVVDVDEGHRIQLPLGVDPEKALILSSTQFDTHEMCERKWWFRWPMGLPEPPRDFLAFGKALHAVCERYLLADDLGRVDGLPVDLYPRGWDEGLSKAEADLIQRLIAKGIEAGLLVRGKDRLIEHPFMRPLVKHQDIEVFVVGYIDLALLADAEVQDHKTTKSLRWVKSPKALAETTQMRLYGREVLALRDERGLPPCDVVSVRHNVYVKNAEEPAVKIVRATITREQIEERWAELQRRAQRMVEVKQRFRRPEDWHRLPNPTNVHKACLAYGGCPYQTICGGRESPQEYRRRVERLCDESSAKKAERNDMGNTFRSALAAIKRKNGKAGGKAPPINGTADVDEPADVNEPADDATFWVSAGGKTIGLTGEQIREQLAAGTLSLGTSAMPKGTGSKTWQTLGDLGFVDPTPTEEEAPPPPDEEEAPPAPDAEDEPPPAPDTPEPEEMSGNVSDALNAIAKAGKDKKKGSKAKPVIDGPAPWAFPGCIACQATPGFNSRGNPCRVCDDMQAKAGGTTSADFDITTDGTGRVTWTPKNGQAPAASAPLPNGNKPVTAKAPSAPPKAEEPPAAPAAPATPPVEALLKKGPGRPKTTFRLYINCLPVGVDVIDLTEILKVYGAKLAEASKVESFYALDVFARRDALGSLAETIAAEVEGKRVVAQIPTGASDLRSLADALRAYASEVVVGTVL